MKRELCGSEEEAHDSSVKQIPSGKQPYGLLENPIFVDIDR